MKTGLKLHTQTKLYRNHGKVSVTQSLTRLHQVRYARRMNGGGLVDGDGTLLPRHLPGRNER